MPTNAARRELPDGRWHFQHGPIDCVVMGEGNAGAVVEARERAWHRFRPLLDELTSELPLLRLDLSAVAIPAAPRGSVASRMVAACRPHAVGGRFITAMAAVAGSVAEELIAPFEDDLRVQRAYVNNGGDIALCLRPGTRVQVGTVADLPGVLAGLAPEGRLTIDAASPIRGIATSGWRGRSFSLGIADAVTVLARTASVADATATIVANEVNLDADTAAAAGIVRRPADTIRDDTDLADRHVTVAVPPLPPALVEQALANGAREADAEIAAGRIVACILSLQGRWRVCGDIGPSLRLPEPSRPC